ncbi:MAG: shikimate kinase [Coriobacteriaceae bacterium]|nr:shikimate kinase [Coriobacteriaceae bacterium]
MPRFGLLGEHLGHSWSPQIHAMLGSVPYDLFEVAPDDAAGFIRSGAWDGINVTIPYKKLAAELADERSPRVEALGAANTLIRRPDGSIFAENTDVLGFSRLLEGFCADKLGASAHDALAGKHALILGTGGAAQAVAYVLEQMVGMTAILLTHARIDELNGMGSAQARILFHEGADAALIVNTTPVGMAPNCPEIPLEHWLLDKVRMPELEGVVDIVYNPRITGICFQADARKIPWTSGLPMLVWQAIHASELFQGKELDHGVADEIIGAIEKQSSNIIRIGMPGFGKSSAGRLLAEMTGRAFVDTDEEVEKLDGRSPATIIEQEGEEPFRKIEHEVIRRSGAGTGQVIACGGGVVTRVDNYGPLHQNGTIVFLDRPIEELSSQGRPLSQKYTVEGLARLRMHWYRTWADHRIATTGSARGDAEAIRAQLGI